MSKKRKAKKTIEALKNRNKKEEETPGEPIAPEITEEPIEEPVEPIEEPEEPKEPTPLDVHRQHIARVKEIARDKKMVGAKGMLGIVREEKARAKDDRIAKVNRDASRNHNV